MPTNLAFCTWIFCELKHRLSNQTYIIGLVYLSPTSSLGNFRVLNSIIAEIIVTHRKPLLLVGDFNARIGIFDNFRIPDIAGNWWQEPRCSKDSILNARGKCLISCITQNDLIVLNGCTLSDLAGEFTFVNRNGA